MEEIKSQQTTQQTPQPISQTSNITKTVPQNRQIPKLKRFLPIIIIVLIVATGIASGLVLSSRAKGSDVASQSAMSEENLSPEQKQSFNQTFRDEAEGVIEKNEAMDKYAQGTHKLIRPGGESQTAYLTSSTLDLDDFNGKKVKVFGETFGSSQVGWLMDVGKVEVVN